jgi:hypothetical protein
VALSIRSQVGPATSFHDQSLLARTPHRHPAGTVPARLPSVNRPVARARTLRPDKTIRTRFPGFTFLHFRTFHFPRSFPRRSPTFPFSHFAKRSYAISALMPSRGPTSCISPATCAIDRHSRR